MMKLTLQRKRSPWRLFELVVLALAVLGPFCATPLRAETAAERDARMEWWRDARFGMFIHWGLYAIPAGEWQGEKISDIGEWIMHHADIPLPEYKQLAKQFKPTAYDPVEVARVAKNAGMKYVVVTSKHHDGFCLFDTKATDWDVVDATPNGRDLLSPLAKACRAEGLKFCLYYSIMDWHHPAQEPGPEGHNPTLIKAGRKPEYVAYMKTQLDELLDSCDPEVLWFDGEWPAWWTEEDGRDLYNFLRARKPNLIINNRIGKGRNGMQGFNKADREYVGDFGTPEQEIPAAGLPGVDWESCMTMNDTWGYKKNDHHWKSSETLIRNLVDTASKGGNYLLNIGPTAEGRIPDAILERLAAIGDWMHVNGESIYDTSASPFDKTPWGRVTRRVGDRRDELYLHVFEWPADHRLAIPAVNGEITSAKLLSSGVDLKSDRIGDELVIQLPPTAPDAVDSVVKLVVQKR